MFLDDTYGYNSIQKFAAGIKNISESEKEFFNEHFHDDKSNEFYKGLLTGYANSYSLMENNVKMSEYTKIIAFIADKLAKRGL
jgi:hypothetical protein